MYGALYKLFNIKLIYLSAIFVFEIGSLVCAVSPSSTVFIVGRAIAGVSELVRTWMLIADVALDWMRGHFLRVDCHSITVEYV